MAKFKVNDNVKFKRNSLINSDSTPIAGVVELKEGQKEQVYVLENSYGWNPDVIRKKTYNLKDDKKYLFVSENELTAI